MKTFNWSAVGLLATTLVVACDPYEDEDKSAPSVVAVTATSGTEATVGEFANNAWAVTVPTTCAGGDVTADQPVIFVTFNKQMNGASIQATPGDCTPAGEGDGWLTVDPPAPAGSKWYTCYTPSSPQSSEGGAAIIFLGDEAAEDAEATCADEGVPAPEAWAEAGSATGEGATVGSYHFTGQVTDKQGRVLPIDFTANFEPDPGGVQNFTVSNTTATSVTLRWDQTDAVSCVTDPAVFGNVKYSIRQMNADEEFVQVPNGLVDYTGPGTKTLEVTGLTGDTPYTFELFTVTTPATGAEEVEEARALVENATPGLAVPTAPTGVAFTPGATEDDPDVISFTFTPVTGATDHDVYRAEVADGEVGEFERLGGANTDATVATTFEDDTIHGGTEYVYAIVPVKTVGTGADAVDLRGPQGPASAPELTRPDAPAAGEALEIQTDSVDLRWDPVAGATTYAVQRAPDVSGAPGTYAATTGTLVATEDDVTFAQTGLTTGTTYWYRLVATNAAGSRNGADTEVATAALPAPTGVTATAAGTGATVTWTAVAGAQTYLVERAVVEGAAPDDVVCGYAPVSAPVTGTTLTDPGPLTTGVTYSYRVTAQSATGTSGPSAEDRVP